MVWGLLWWLGSGLNEIQRHLSGRPEVDASVVFVALSVEPNIGNDVLARYAENMHAFVGRGKEPDAKGESAS